MKHIEAFLKLFSDTIVPQFKSFWNSYIQPTFNIDNSIKNRIFRNVFEYYNNPQGKIAKGRGDHTYGLLEEDVAMLNIFFDANVESSLVKPLIE